MSARSKPYPPETKTEEIDLAHLYELWSECVCECFWCYALRSLEWALLSEMRHTFLPLDSTHVDNWVKQTAFIIYLLSYRSSEVIPCTNQTLSQHMANIFLSICALSLLFDCYVILVGSFQNGDCWNWRTELLKQWRNIKIRKCKASLLQLKPHRLREKLRACQGKGPNVTAG